MNLQPGDIFATRGARVARWVLRNLIYPPTDRFHFGILWRKSADGDFFILESISKGVAIGLLSWYDVSKLQFYRVDCPMGLRFRAPNGLIEWGRSRYDYLLILKLLFGFLLAFTKILTVEERVRRIRAEDLPYCQNSSLICTEAVDVAYDSVGVNIIPEGVIPIPNSFRQAEIEGRIGRITE